MKKIEEELWGGFAYPLQLAAKELLTKANPDEGEDRTKDEKPRSLRERLRRK